MNGFFSSADAWFVYGFLALGVLLAIVAYFIPDPPDAPLCGDGTADPDCTGQHWVNPF